MEQNPWFLTLKLLNEKRTCDFVHYVSSVKFEYFFWVTYDRRCFLKQVVLIVNFYKFIIIIIIRYGRNGNPKPQF